MSVPRLFLFSCVALAALVPLAGCGTRTGLLDSLGAAGDAAKIHVDCAAPPWLLFDVDDNSPSAVSTIYAMRADGTELHAVPLPHSPAYYPSVSPDGTKLLYATSFVPTTDGGNDTNLYLYDFASQTSSLVVSSFGLSYSAISPDLQTVAYSANYVLSAIGADGTNNRSLIAGSPDNGGYGHPTFASDSKTVLYGTLGVVGSIEIDGSNNQTLLTGVAQSFWYPNPAFSPDYSQVAVGIFCSQQSPFDLLVFAYATLADTACSSGTVLTEVTESSAQNMGATDPSWGPTGLIAYGSGSDVWVIPSTGGTPTNLTSKLTGDAGVITASDPVWAPSCAAVP